MRVVWTLGAQEDAQHLVAILAERSPAAADRLAEELDLAAERLSDFPRLGIAAGGTFRYLLVAGGDYRLIYKVAGDTVRILGVGRGAQTWPRLSE